MAQVLEGLSVVDLSNTITGAQASQQLADYGAEVVHVEPPGGSPLRDHPSYPFWARGKRSIVLDLKAPADLEVVRALAGEADVLLETFRPGVADRLGVGYDRLSAANPRLVYGSVTGFGAGGPYAGHKGYEGIVAAKTGAMSQLAGMADREGPSFPSVLFGSYIASQLLAQGVLAALYERTTSGLGQRVETSLLRGLSVMDTFNWFARVIAQRYGAAFPQAAIAVKGVPSGGLSFRLLIALTKDGRWLQFSQTVDRLYRAMMTCFGLDWMFSDEKFKTAPEFDDIDVRVEYWEHMLAAVRSKTVAEWQVEFDRHPDVWGEMFRHGTEVLDHPQMQWNGQVEIVDDPVYGKVRQPGPVAQLDRSPAALRPAPLLDADGAQLRARVANSASRTNTNTNTNTATAGTTERRPPLDGIVCLELGTYYAAPFGTTLLAELGARVIKIEQLDGDPMRNMLPFPEIAGIKALQGKESLAVDIATEEGRKIVYALAERADIVMQSFRAGVAEKQKVDADTLQAINPNLVYVSSPGYGVGGPNGRRPAFAPTIGAATGQAWRNAGSCIPESPDLTLDEVKSSALRMALAVMGVGNADGFSATTVGTALVLGLLARARGAGAQQLRTSMVCSTSHALSESTIEYAGQAPPPTADSMLYGFHALYRLYQAADGWVFLAAPSQREWLALCAALASHSGAATTADLGADPRFATVESRRANDDSLIEALTAVFARRSAAEWERDLVAGDVACAEVAPAPIEGNYMDEGKVGRLQGLVTEAHHPTLDSHPRLKPMVEMSRSSGVAGGGCLVGQHTDSVMAWLGYSDDRIAALRASGVLGG